jgi:hypothetical protein
LRKPAELAEVSHDTIRRRAIKPGEKKSGFGYSILRSLPPGGRQGRALPSISRPTLDVFSQLRRSGKGMGLSIARTIIEMHGGSIKVEDQTGGGATFRVQVPIRSEG